MAVTRSWIRRTSWSSGNRTMRWLFGRSASASLTNYLSLLGICLGKALEPSIVCLWCDTLLVDIANSQGRTLSLSNLRKISSDASCKLCAAFFLSKEWSLHCEAKEEYFGWDSPTYDQFPSLDWQNLEECMKRQYRHPSPWRKDDFWVLWRTTLPSNSFPIALME